MTNRKAPSDDFERLEAAIRGLVEESRRLSGENIGLRRDLESRDRKIRELDERLIEANQLRQDAIKRIDDLLGQVDHIDAQLATGAVAGGK